MSSSDAGADPERLLGAIDAAVGLFRAEAGTGAIRPGVGLRRLLGFDEAAGEETVAMADIAHADDVAALEAAMLAAAAGQGGGVRLRLRRATGEVFPVSVQVFPADSSGSTSEIVGVVTPIHAEPGDKPTAIEASGGTEEVDVITRIVGGVAHDFNNLLAVILGNVDIMSPEDDVDTFEQSRDDIAAACLRGSELIRRMVAFAEISNLQPSRVNLRSLLGEQAGAGAELHRPPDLWDVAADPPLLKSAVEAIIRNAREATPEGGVVEVGAENLTIGPADPAALPPGRYVTLRVSDEGPGVPAPMIEKIFEPFISTKKPGVGAGLGLSMARGFARQSGGDVVIRNRPGGGATVTLTLPAEMTAPAVATAPPPDFDAWLQHSGRVLLVDDEPEVLRYVRLTLEGMGLDVSAASSGAEALAIFEAAPDRFDVLLTDIVMPGPLNGRALAAALRRARPDLKVGYLSGFSSLSRDDPGEDGAEGASDDVFLEKPIRAERLIAAISSLLGARETG